jgi:hypothetical protein
VASDAPSPERVALASAMVAVQTGRSIEAALQLLEETALATDCTLDELAVMVIDRDVDFG